jgi:hypothetical protein
MTDDPQNPGVSSFRVETLRRLEEQLQRMENARHRSPPGSETISSGITPLDALLPEKGFRAGVLIEWLAHHGVADQLALLAARPALGNQGGDQRFLVVIDPEKTFFPPAAISLGIDLDRLVLIHPKEHTETLWALEQTLRSAGVAVALCRLQQLSTRVFRRLQLAAERGGGIGFLLRPLSARREPSWSDVRLRVEAGENSSSSKRQWRVEVLHCRRGNSGERSVILEYDDATHAVHPASGLAPAVPSKPAVRA